MFLIILSLFGAIATVFLLIKNNKKTDQDPNRVPNNPTESDEKKKERANKLELIIRDILKSEGIGLDQRNWIVAQAKHETANFTSNLAVNHNNFFGMKVPTKRESLRNGTYTAPNGEIFSTFESPEDSVQDFVLYYEEMGLKKQYANLNAYIKALHAKGYFTDEYSNYLNGVRRWL